MTANDSTSGIEESPADGIDYERLGRETAVAELQRHGIRLRDRLTSVADEVEQGELTDEDLAELQKELANAQVWVARVAEGRYLRADEVLGDG